MPAGSCRTAPPPTSAPAPASRCASSRSRAARSTTCSTSTAPWPARWRPRRKAGRSAASSSNRSGTAKACPDALPAYRRPLPFLYESTGVETQFTNLLDPEPRSREVFTFHRPETASRVAPAGGLRAEPARAPRRRRATGAVHRGRHPACPPQDPPATDHRRPLAGPDHRHPEPRGVAGREQAARPDPDGDRLRQDVHRVQLHLPPGEVCEGQAHPVPGRPRQPRPPGGEGVPAVRHARRRPQVHRALRRPAPQLATSSTRPRRS